MPVAFRDTLRHQFPQCFWLVHPMLYNLCDIISQSKRQYLNNDYMPGHVPGSNTSNVDRVSHLLDHTASSGAYILFRISKLLDTYSRLVLIPLLVSMWVNKAVLIDSLGQCFSALVLLTFWARNSFCRDVFVYCKMCNSLPGLSSLDASNIIPVGIFKNVSRQCQILPGRQISYLLHSGWKLLA